MGFELKILTNEERQKYGMRIVPENEIKFNTFGTPVDEDEDVCLYGQDRDMDSGIHVYILYFQGEHIEVWLYRGLNEFKDRNKKLMFDVKYQIDHIKLPIYLKNQISKIKESIKEALVVQGWNYTPESTGKTTVENIDEARIEYK